MKALLVAKDASRDDVAARIEEAAGTTWQQTERDSTKEEDRRNREAGVQFLSQGGSNETTNRSGVCTPCHLRGIHRGFLRVTGRGGVRLTWRFGAANDGAPVETFVTEGDDDVRRAG